MSGAEGKTRILVADDEQEIQDVTRMVLADAGYDVQVTSNGRDALSRVGSEPFDLLLLDINMPEMDGWETLRLIRADEALNDLTVVMFSVKGEVRDKIQGLQEGAADYITKPFVVDVLLDRVRRVLDERGRRPPTGAAAP